jgi:NAD(P)-dependent dehydrogenase (short-subunit alcohol dehydrogenase family)
LRLEGKVALISGGARGIGAATARLFAREGASVVVGDLLENEGRGIEEDVNNGGGQAVFVRVDVTKEADWGRVVDSAIARFGRLDILMNNAAILRKETVLDTTERIWDEVMAVNAKGVFLGTKAAIHAMRKSGGGSIINVSSTSGLVGTQRTAAYQASKGAVRIFTKVTAIQYARDGIRANSIYPGPIDTEMIAARLATPEQRAEVNAHVPLGRIGVVDDIAYGALFLASDESSYVTGAELVIDGGVTAR